MSATILPGDFVKIGFWMSRAGYPAAIFRDYEVTLTTGTPLLSGVMPYFDGRWPTWLAPCLTVDVQQEGTSAQIVSPMASAREWFPNLNPGIGAGGTLLLPPNLSGLGFYRTDNPAPRTRGRQFIPFPPGDAFLSNHNPTPTLRNDIEASCTQLATTRAFNTGTGLIRMVSVVLDAANGVGWPIMAVESSPEWGNQRRRGHGSKGTYLPT